MAIGCLFGFNHKWYQFTMNNSVLGEGHVYCVRCGGVLLRMFLPIGDGWHYAQPDTKALIKEKEWFVNFLEQPSNGQTEHELREHDHKSRYARFCITKIGAYLDNKDLAKVGSNDWRDYVSPAMIKRDKVMLGLEI